MVNHCLFLLCNILSDANTEMSNRFSVKGFPTLIYVPKETHLAHKFTGNCFKNNLIKLLREPNIGGV